VLFASLCLSAILPGAASWAGVGSIQLEGLWRRSETVVLGRVERIERIPREVPRGRPRNTNERWVYEPSVPFAVVAVQRVFRGAQDLKSVLVFSQSTWVCDVTRAEPGETAIFFLERSGVAEREGEVFRTVFAAVAGDQEVHAIGWSGRGRLPVRRVDDREVVDFWPEVQMPESLAAVDGPDPRRSFIRSVALDQLTATLEGFASLEDRPLLAATVFSGNSADLAWDLLVAEDGWCRLTIHMPPMGQDAFPDPKRDRHRIFRVAADRIGKLTEVLRKEWTADLPRFVGSADSLAWQREIRWFRRLPTADGGIMDLDDSVKIAAIDKARMTDVETRRRTVPALRIWREVRELFDVPNCVDLRPDDAHWVE
jgi:hypothetical protein